VYVTYKSREIKISINNDGVEVCGKKLE